MSADSLDQASEIETLERERIIAAARNRGPELPRTGFCHNCREPVPELFCDSDCRDDWEKRRRLR